MDFSFSDPVLLLEDAETQRTNACVTGRGDEWLSRIACVDTLTEMRRWRGGKPTSTTKCSRLNSRWTLRCFLFCRDGLESDVSAIERT